MTRIILVDDEDDTPQDPDATMQQSTMPPQVNSTSTLAMQVDGTIHARLAPYGKSQSLFPASRLSVFIHTDPLAPFSAWYGGTAQEDW